MAQICLVYIFYRWCFLSVVLSCMVLSGLVLICLVLSRLVKSYFVFVILHCLIDVFSFESFKYSYLYLPI